MSRTLCSALLLLLAAAAPTTGVTADPAAVIIVQTDGSSRHLNRPRPAGWLALIEGDQGARLAPTRLHLTHKRDPARDDLYDSDLWASAHPAATYLLRQPSLRAGPVTQVELPADPVISDPAGPRRLELAFGHKVYEFRTRRVDAHDPGLRQVTLGVGGRMTVLYDWRRAHSTSDNMEIVRWAGDLDRDGRLDFIVDFNTYGSTTTCLFLSRQARPDEIVRRIGCTFSSA